MLESKTIKENSIVLQIWCDWAKHIDFNIFEASFNLFLYLHSDHLLEEVLFHIKPYFLIEWTFYSRLKINNTGIKASLENYSGAEKRTLFFWFFLAVEITNVRLFLSSIEFSMRILFKFIKIKLAKKRKPRWNNSNWE